jgi:hypothetical protein
MRRRLQILTAFNGGLRLAGGPPAQVALAVKAVEADSQGTILVFDDQTGAVVDLDLRGSVAEITARFPDGEATETVAEAPEETTRPRGRGRPRLGVVAREITLLPRHWDWLEAQAGSASQVLRRLIDEARRADSGQAEARAARERTYRFLSAIAGDLPGFEDASRALFAGDLDAFGDRMDRWPGDIKTYAMRLAGPRSETDWT